MSLSPVEAMMTRITADTKTGCWLWNRGKTDSGYGMIYREGINQLAHRESWRIFHGQIPPKRWVLHSCDKPACVNPSHLYLGGHAENMQDAKNRRRMANGERHPMARLLLWQVREIRKRFVGYKNGFGAGQPNNAHELAEEFMVSAPTIINIARRKTWIYDE